MTKENRTHGQNDQRGQTAFENSAIGIIMADFNELSCPHLPTKPLKHFSNFETKAFL
jgi:hypothetical protein